ncbi:MAG: M28 family peptidase [Bacteroidota bacterium]
MNRSLLTIALLFSFLVLSFGQNQVPVVRILNLQIDEDKLTIDYSLEDAENDEMEVSLRVSDDGGKSFDLSVTSASGDIGFPVQAGANRQIEWDYAAADVMGSELTVQLIADDRQEVDIQAIVDQVDSNRLRADLEFVEGIRFRNFNRNHLREVQDSLFGRMVQDCDLAYEQQFERGSYTARNIIGDIIGQADNTSVHIVDAHYDTVSNSPGADDNGSGVVGFLEVLRVLAPYSFEETVRFIGFDLEEEGLLGSQEYVANGIPAHETISSVFNFEMIGYFDDTPNTQIFPSGFEILFPDVFAQLVDQEFRGNFVTNVGIQLHEELLQAFDTAAARYVPELNNISLVADRLTFPPPDLLRSDHASFWLEGLPAIMLTDGANFRNPHYHDVGDTVDKLNFGFMANVVKATVGALAERAGIKHSGQAVSSISISTSVAEPLCQEVVQVQPAMLVLPYADCRAPGTTARILSMDGRLMNSQILRQETLEISTSSWSSGIYIVQFESKGQSFIQKVFLP